MNKVYKDIEDITLNEYLTLVFFSCFNLTKEDVASVEE